MVPYHIPMPWDETPAAENLEREPRTISFGGNSYCGPAALAYILGIDPDQAAKLLREKTGRRAVKGAPTFAMTRVLFSEGMCVEHAMFGLKRPTFKEWFLETPLANKLYLVNVTGHYIVVHGGYYFDNGAHLGKPVSKGNLRKRVQSAWEIQMP